MKIVLNNYYLISFLFFKEPSIECLIKVSVIDVKYLHENLKIELLTKYF